MLDARSEVGLGLPGGRKRGTFPVMTETTLLSGKVVKRTLPVVPVPTGPGAPTVKRLLLPQGELAQFFDGDPPMRYLARIELRAGQPRGNHYHTVKEEWIYVARGELRLLVEDIASKERAKVGLQAGDVVVIATRIAHTLQPVTDGEAIEFSPARFDPADIHRYPLP
jgi:hypothetical protein